MAKPKLFVKVWKGLVDEKHFSKMGQSIWLFLWLLDNSWEDGEVTLYTHSMCMEAFDVSKVTARRWLTNLRTQGYIIIKHTGRGSTVRIKKWAGQQRVAKMSTLAEQENSEVVEREHPGVVEHEHPDVSEHEHPSYRKTKKTIKTKDINLTPQQEWVKVLCDVTRKDPKMMGGRIAKLSKKLRDADYTLGDVHVAFGKGGHWWTEDWRGKKNQEPTMAQVLSEIGKYSGKVKGIQQAAKKTMAERAAEIDGGSK